MEADGSQKKRKTRPSSSGADRRWLHDGLWALALAIGVLAVYSPAWHGGYLPDDKLIVQRRDLHSWEGLYRIWFDPKATPQYYPAMSTLIWAQDAFWAGDTLGYHIVSILLHVGSAVLIAVILRRLGVPGARLAALVFALHPVQVESVAWIAETKNTLSTLFFLAAVLCYLEFDRSRTPARYCGSLLLFVLSLLSKTTACTWPAVMLLIFWWQRGKLSWRRDFVPLIPCFLAAAAVGVLVAGLERSEWMAADIPLLHRPLIGGRALWFYLAKLFWPWPVIVAYPRWELRGDAWWQWLFPAAALLGLALAWSIRRRVRWPLAAVLFFAGMLFPFLGAFNCAYFGISYVADHFQYLACLGAIVPACAGLALVLQSPRAGVRRAGYGLCTTIVLLLAVLTARQATAYVDLATLFRRTLEVNPLSGHAWDLLGLDALEKGRLSEAEVDFQESARVDPHLPSCHYHLGKVRLRHGQVDLAMESFQKCLELLPRFASAHLEIAHILVKRGDFDQAIVHYRKALAIEPDYPAALNELGLLLAGRGRLDEASAQFQKAIACYAPFAGAYNNLGKVLACQGKLDEAMVNYRQALAIKPQHVEAHFNLAEALARQGELAAAADQYEAALRLDPHFDPARRRLNELVKQPPPPDGR